MTDPRPRWTTANSDPLPWLDARLQNPVPVAPTLSSFLPSSLPTFHRHSRHQRSIDFSQFQHRSSNHANTKTVLSDGVDKYTETDANPFFASKRVLRDLDELERLPLTGVYAGPVNDNLMQLSAVIEGPAETPYEGGIFFIDISIPTNYPFRPPELNFRTRIYHPNINSQGIICLSLLSNDWTPEMTLSKIFESIVSLLYSGNFDEPLVPSIAETYLNDPKQFETIARQWTQSYSNCNFDTQNL